MIYTIYIRMTKITLHNRTKAWMNIYNSSGFFHDAIQWNWNQKFWPNSCIIFNQIIITSWIPEIIGRRKDSVFSSPQCCVASLSISESLVLQVKKTWLRPLTVTVTKKFQPGCLPKAYLRPGFQPKKILAYSRKLSFYLATSWVSSDIVRWVFTCLLAARRHTHTKIHQ